MEVLTFTDPRAAGAYWDRFEDRSIKPIQPYLWRFPSDEVRTEETEPVEVTPVRREELSMMVLDENEELRVDAAIWAQTNGGSGSNAVLMLTHHQPEGSVNPWDTKVLTGFFDKIQVENLIAQLGGAAAGAFSVVE